MPRTRLITWLLLLLSLAFFFVRTFRRALEAPLANFWIPSMGGAGRQNQPFPGLARLFTLARYASPERLRRLADDALRRNDFEFVAFATLELPLQPGQEETLRLADQVAASRRDLTWIYLPLCLRMISAEGPAKLSAKASEEIRARLDRLEAFDPDNAAPHLVRAKLIAAARNANLAAKPPDASKLKAAALQQAEWQKEMEVAFTKPRLDSYTVRAFELTRKVMVARRWDHPVVFCSTFEDYPHLDFSPALDYAHVLVDERGKTAEDAGRIDEALRDYLRVAEVGLRLRLRASTLMEEFMGEAIQGQADQRLPSALKKARRDAEALLIQELGQQRSRRLERQRSPLVVASNNLWSAVVANFAALLVALFSAVSLISVVYLNAKGRAWGGEKGRAFELLCAAENYAPVFLFASCVALYLSSVPFAQNFTHYMTSQERLTFIPADLLARSYPLLYYLSYGGLAPANPFPEYAPWALTLLVLATALGWVHRRRAAVVRGPEMPEVPGKAANRGVAVLVFLTGIVAVSATGAVWEFALVAEVVLALLILSTVWVTSSFSERLESETGRRWPTWIAGIASVLLLLLMAVVSGSFFGFAARVVAGRHDEDWLVLVACLPGPVAGVVGALRMRHRKIALGAFALAAAVVAFIVYR